MKVFVGSVIVLLGIYSCAEASAKTDEVGEEDVTEFEVNENPEFADVDEEVIYIDSVEQFYFDLFKSNRTYVSDGFDYPVGKPDAEGYYDIQPFTEDYHLGEDWNRNNAGNKDKGDPVYSIANGVIHHIEDYGKSTGWGKCIHVIHCVGDTALYESVYAHVDTMLVKRGQLIKRGEQIGTIGDCYGEYYAHLHFELRDSINMGIGVGYSVDTSGYISPKDFINENRPK